MPYVQPETPGSQATPMRCWTAAGCLIHQDKVLLVKHKKLGIWLNPGGHIEPNELPHQAAEREFFEETGVRVRAKTTGMAEPSPDSERLPVPFNVDLHWVCQENYDQRLASADPTQRSQTPTWPKGCEQHIGFLYLLEPENDNVTFAHDENEVTAIGWFSEAELDDLETLESIRMETRRAFAFGE